MYPPADDSQPNTMKIIDDMRDNNDSILSYFILRSTWNNLRWKRRQYITPSSVFCWVWSNKAYSRALSAKYGEYEV